MLKVLKVRAPERVTSTVLATENILSMAQERAQIPSPFPSNAGDRRESCAASLIAAV